MSSSSAFDPSTTVSFVIKNNSSIKRTIKVFNQGIAFGSTQDLMKIPGVTEEDIRTEVLKGSLKSKLSSGALQVVSSTVNFNTSDPIQGAFLKSVGITPTGVTGSSDPLAQGTWYIDPVNGSDINDGKTSGTALKTHAELSRRWGPGHPLLVGQPSTAISPIQLVTVYLLGDLPVSDPLDIQLTVGPNTLLAYIGTVTAIRTGTISAVTTKDRNTNTAQTVADGTAFTASDIGKRVRVTSGANAGQFAWVVKDNGGNVVRTTSFSTPTMPGVPDVMFQTGLTTGTVSVSDPYALENMTKVYIRQIDVRGPVGGTGTVTTIGFCQLDFQNNGGSLAPIPFLPNSIQGIFKSCRWTGGLVYGLGVTRSIFLNCLAHNPRVGANTAINIQCPFFWRGGGCIGHWTNRNFGIGVIDDDALCQSGGFSAQTNGSQIGTFAIFDSQDNGINISGNAGMGTTAVCMTIAGGSGTHLLWGSGNTNFGIFCLGGSQLNYQSNIPTITGSSGDFSLGTGTTAFRFSAADGYYVGGINSTWAKLAEAQPGGFGGNAHQPDRNAHICVRG